MIKRRTFSVLLIAIVMGVGAALMADRWIQQRLMPVEAAVLETTPVVVAALMIPFGQKIEPAHLKIIDWPKETPLPTGVIHDRAQVEGKIANQKIHEGELVLESRVVEHVSGSTLAAIITPEKRAITLRVNDVVGVAGFLLPGNKVDILASKKISQKHVSTKTILEDLKVLAVDQTSSPDKDKPIVVRAVTVEASPAEAEKIFKATEEGRIQLVLRNPIDDSRVVKVDKPKAAPQKTKPRVSRNTNYGAVTIIRGTNVNIAKARY